MVSVQAGASVPHVRVDLTPFSADLRLADREYSGTPGVAVGAQYLYHAGAWWGLGGDVAYASFGDKSNSNHPHLVTTGGDILTAHALFRLTTFPGWQMSPYAAGGLGFSAVTQRVVSRPNAPAVAWPDGGSEERALVDHRSLGWSVSGAAGVEGEFTPGWVAAIEARWIMAKVDGPVVGVAQANALHFLFRLGWAFGEPEL